MFNFGEARTRATDILKEVRADTGDWRKTIDYRWGTYLILRASRNLESVSRLCPMIADAPDRQKFLDHVNEQCVEAQQDMVHALQLLRGTAVLKDPVGNEALLRTIERTVDGAVRT